MLVLSSTQLSAEDTIDERLRGPLLIETIESFDTSINMEDKVEDT